MLPSSWQPRKKWGQSFLRDGNIVRKIIELCDFQPGEVVVEIGPGEGTLTLPIAEKVKKLIAVEIDPYLIARLKDVMAGIFNVELIQGDILTFDFTSCAMKHGVKKLKVVGNIPYSISGPILFHVLAARNNISSAIFMVQKEVAERLTAQPGTKNYGLPTVMLATYAHVRRGFDVTANCFRPRPRVNSAVVRIDFFSQPQEYILDEAHFSQLVKVSFAHRRKTLMNNLLKGYGANLSYAALRDVFVHLGLNEQIRAESLTPIQFIELSNALVSLKK